MSPLDQVFEDTHVELYRRARAVTGDDASAEATMRAAYARAAREPIDEDALVASVGPATDLQHEPPLALVEALRSSLATFDAPRRMALGHAVRSRRRRAFIAAASVVGALAAAAPVVLRPTALPELQVGAAPLSQVAAGVYGFTVPEGPPALALLHFVFDKPGFAMVNGVRLTELRRGELVVPPELLKTDRNIVILSRAARRFSIDLFTRPHRPDVHYSKWSALHETWLGLMLHPDPVQLELTAQQMGDAQKALDRTCAALIASAEEGWSHSAVSDWETPARSSVDELFPNNEQPCGAYLDAFIAEHPPMSGMNTAY